jgi:hypothetical protein
VKLRVNKRVATAGAGLAIAAGVGGAYAATRDNPTPAEQRQAVINDVAKRLGVQPNALTNAFKAALADQVDAAVAAGRLTKAQGDALKARIQSAQVPFFGGLGGFGHHGPGFGPGASLDAAAAYLGLTQAELFTALRSGKTLAQVAGDKNKSVDGLVSAIVAAEKTHLDQDVKDGRITSAQEQQILSDLPARAKAMVNGTGFGRFGHVRARGGGAWFFAPPG